MIVTPYLHYDMKHRLYARDFFISHGMNPDLVYDLPEYGLIALRGDKPVAMGFIRRIEGPYAMFDSFITHKQAQSSDRNRALDHIVKKLLKHLRDSEVRRVLAFSGFKDIINRGIRHGFKHFPCKMIILAVDK